MAIAMRFSTNGDTNAAGIVNVKMPNDVPLGHVLLKQNFAGVNYIDLLMQQGKIKHCHNNNHDKFYIPGFEATGIVQSTANDVKWLKPGDRVVYATWHTPGAFQDYRLIEHDYLIRIPDAIDERIVAASFFRGMMAHTLLRRTFIAGPKHVILIHAAAGRLGSILCNWAANLGVYVIGTVGSEVKKDIAKQAGCRLVLNYNTEPWVEAIMELTKGIGVDAVYDGVGKDTFTGSIRALVPCGIFISHGSVSGHIPNVNDSILGNKSLFFTYPKLFDYKAKHNKKDLIIASNEYFFLLQNKVVKINLDTACELRDAQLAVTSLESRDKTAYPLIKLSS